MRRSQDESPIIYAPSLSRSCEGCGLFLARAVGPQGLLAASAQHYFNFAYFVRLPPDGEGGRPLRFVERFFCDPCAANATTADQTLCVRCCSEGTSAPTDGFNVDLVQLNSTTVFCVCGGARCKAEMLEIHLNDPSVEGFLQCQGCGALTKERKRCSRCKKAYYCSVACQKAAWDGHKAECRAD